MENKIIIKYFDGIETALISNIIIENYDIIRKNISDFDGKIRIRALLKNKDLLDLFEYIVGNSNELITKKYHFHWQNKNAELIMRWDNAPHHKGLKNFPHHIHYNDRIEAFYNEEILNILNIIKEIEKIYYHRMMLF